MAIVQMKCPNCGGAMEFVNNQYVCPHCNSIVLNIVDAKIDADVSIIDAEEFARKIEESKRQFVVRINDRLEVFDVDTKIINKKIQDANKYLAEGKYYNALSCLNDVPKDILSAERIRYLANYKVKNEYELSLVNGYVNENGYSHLLTLCDEQTAATYRKIEEYCMVNYDRRQTILPELKKIDDLIAVDLRADAVTYATELCNKYPATAICWEYLIKAKLAVEVNDSSYEGFWDDFKKMKTCEDYNINAVSDKHLKTIECALTRELGKIDKQIYNKEHAIDARYESEISSIPKPKNVINREMISFGWKFPWGKEDEYNKSFCCNLCGNMSWKWCLAGQILAVIITVITLLIEDITEVKDITLYTAFAFFFSPAVFFIARPMYFWLMNVLFVPKILFFPFWLIFCVPINCRRKKAMDTEAKNYTKDTYTREQQILRYREAEQKEIEDFRNNSDLYKLKNQVNTELQLFRERNA